MQWFRPKELPLITGAFIGCVCLAVAISNFAIVPMADAMGVRPALSVLGTVSLVGVVFWLAFGRAHDVREDGTQRVRESVLSILRSRNTLLIAVADTGPFVLYTVSLAWLPTFFHEQHGISLADAGSLMGILSMAGLVSLLLAMLLTFHVRRRRPFLIFPGIVVGFAGLGTFLLAGTPVIYLPIVALGFASWFYLPVLMSLPMELPGASPHRVSVMLAALLTIGGIGTFVGPLAVGATRDLTGSYIPGLALFAVLAWSLAIGGFLLPETGSARVNQ
jgi:cyanate permease